MTYYSNVAREAPFRGFDFERCIHDLINGTLPYIEAVSSISAPTKFDMETQTFVAPAKFLDTAAFSKFLSSDYLTSGYSDFFEDDLFDGFMKIALQLFEEGKIFFPEPRPKEVVIPGRWLSTISGEYYHFMIPA